MAAAKLHHIDTSAMLPLHNDAKTHTLTTPITSIGPGPFTFTGDPSNESPPVPHLAGVQGNSGQLSYAYPIDTPPGPDGFGPALQLAYSSEAVNERHGFNQPTGDIGDGWAFSLGAISADVHGASSAGGSLTWYNLSGVAYNNSYVYTHLGQLWQGPLNGGNTQYQYLYCNNSAPHQLTGMYPLGTTCANLSGAVYKTSYDNWGNATSRTYNGSTTTQTFDLLDQLVKWVNGTTQKQWYAYNTSGERTLLRLTNNSATTMTVYVFGAEEYTYDGSGNLQSSTHYYDMGGRLIGELTGSGTQSTDLFLTDALGSVLTTFSNVQNSAAVQGNQTYGPYGTGQYSQGSMNTNKGYTGQYADPLSGFDYYNARYYDPVAGVFLSADTVQGNMQGMNPYAYVGGNPETYTDPTGEMYAPPGGGLSTGGFLPRPSPPVILSAAKNLRATRDSSLHSE